MAANHFTVSTPARSLFSPREHVAYIILLVLVAFANILTLIPAPLYVRLGGCILLFGLLPGSLLVTCLFAPVRPNRQPLGFTETLLLSSGLSYFLTTLVTLALTYLSMPLYYPTLLGVIDAILFALMFVNYRHRFALRAPTGPEGTSYWPERLALLCILLVAIFLRFGNLGYSEYLGDEADVVYRARQVIVGNGEELFLQRKGPTQIMMTAAFALGTNSVNELALRFPFAWASALSVLGLYVLGKSAWNPQLGLLAAAVLAIDGIVLGFSRLVQYQGVVLLALVLIVYCTYCMSAHARTPLGRRYFSVALVLFGLVLLTHYEAALVAIPMAVIALPERRTWLSRENLRELIIVLSVVIVVLLFFYVPFVLHPHFGQTREVYAGRRIGYGEGPFNNVSRYAASSLFYNSVYYVSLTALLSAVGMITVLTCGLRGILKVSGILAGILAVGGVVIALVSPGMLLVGERSAAFLAFIPALLIAVLPLGRDRTARAALAWYLVNFMAYAFFIKVPGLHYYTMAPAMAIVVALGLDATLQGMRRVTSLRAWPAWAGLGALFLFLAGYPYLLFVRTQPQYAVDFPAHRSPLYWTPQTAIPEGGFFGFTRKSGWKVLAVLYQQGKLRGTYLSNKKQIKPEWTYFRNVPEADENARYFFYDELSARMTEKEKYPIEWITERYRLVGQVRVSGEPRIRIFEQKNMSSLTETRNFDAEMYDPIYDRQDWLRAYRECTSGKLNEGDLAALGRYLSDLAAKGIVLANHPQLVEALNYYYPGPMSCTSISKEIENELQQWAKNGTRVWFIAWDGVNQAATQQALAWLKTHYIGVEERQFGHVRLLLFIPQNKH